MIYIDKSLKEHIYLQIYNQILKDILEGKLSSGTKLKGSRTLAEELGVSRNTVNSSYNQLEAEGYIESEKGKGFIVLEIPKLENYKLKKEIKKEDKFKNRNNKFKDKILFDLHFSNNIFPSVKWKKYSIEAINNYDIIFKERDFKGSEFLRGQIKNHIYETRGVECDSEQIVITNGLQHSLELISDLIFDKNDLIYIEDPCYHSAYSVLEEKVNIKRIPIDNDGIKIHEIENNKVKAIYTTPSHQFPTGIVMSIKRRYELLNWANENEVYIIEDDYDSEFTYYNKPIPSLQSIDNAGRVIYLGTFSKSISTAIRMGYFVIPKNLLEKYRNKKESYGCRVSLLDQYTVARFIESGDYKRHIRRLCSSFKKNHSAFVRGLKSMKDTIKIHTSGAGLWILIEIIKDISLEELVRRARNEGVIVYGPENNWNQTNENNKFVLLGLSHIKHKDIEICIEKLKKAWK
ncbi:PLP-dependent aminotransferase family protein [Miniphocaeibacter massiliensis]|uniref:MocR-like pyridoxine biosynthesis transcription factor PdxR n=1 Tax=Miniphocaeibacter massiliensis TaxID=2041841 RepID=UPI000C0883BC|nr:PLP-dependent aminotransferase family protein [Miniphocaeibacter massiliensis]